MTDIDRRGFLIRSAGSAAAFALVPSLDPPPPALTGKPLPVAVAGVGRQGRALLGELSKLPGVRIAAVCDTDPVRLQAGRRRAREARAYPSLAELLDKQPGVRAVFVATPTHLHRAPVEEALAASREVFCEVPLASTVDDARAIVRAARSSGRIVHAGLQGRTNPVYRLARAFVVSGALRNKISLRAQWHQKTSWRFASSDAARERALNWRLDPQVSLGLPGEVASHQLDTLAWLLNRYPLSVVGHGAVRHHDDGRKLADTVQLEFAWEDGLRLQYDASLASSFEGAYELLRGSNSTIKLARTHAWMFKEADAPTQGWEVYANRQRFHNDEGITLIADATKLAAQGELQKGVGLPNPPLYYAVSSFVQAVQAERPAAVSAEAGYRAAVMGVEAAAALTRGETRALDQDLYKPG